MRLPPDHPKRVELNDEVHARPSGAMAAPLRVSCLALLADQEERERSWQALGELARRHGAPPPAPGINHHSADFGPFALTWERHTEFSRFTVAVPGAGAEPDDPFAEPALALLDPGWVAGLPGQVVSAAHVALLPAPARPFDPGTTAARWFEGNPLVGAVVGGGALAYTDFRIHADGFGRFLVHVADANPRQAGRIVQRLLEIDTYRMMAFLALPVARELAPFLAACERELGAVSAALVDSRVVDEPGLLERLTRLAAEMENRESGSRYRFAAAAAYYPLIQQRIAGLRERRIEGLQTFQEFTERRLAPAMDTCRAIAARQDGLAGRVARVTALLSTRVDLTREGQNQAVLESLDRRAKLQLRLQQTVEGLSVAAITYYVAGLVGYLAKGLKAAGLPIEPDLATGAAIPVVALLIALGLRRVHHMVEKGQD